MKKLLLGSIVLTVFSLSILLFQASCRKDAVAQTTNYILPPATTTTLGGIIVGSGLNVSNTGVLSVTPESQNTSHGQLGLLLFVDNQQFIVSNYDGSNKKVIPINLPAGRQFASNAANGCLSPDGKTLFFEVWESSSNTGFLYSCGVDGSNLKVIHTVNGTYPRVRGAY